MTPSTEGIPVGAYRSSQIEPSLFRGIIVYVILPIALTVLVLTWLLLRRFTLIWISRPTTAVESMVAGLAAWLLLFSILLWFGAIVLTAISFFKTHATIDIWSVILAMVLTGYGTDFILRSRSDFSVDDTQDYIKEAIQFRRSAQSRIDVVSLIKQRKRQRTRTAAGNEHELLQRARLQTSLSKEKELDAQLAVLREGTTVDLIDVWRNQIKNHSHHPFCEKVEEARIEPNRKRFSLFVDFPELDESQFKDETAVLRFNRQVYDFLQSTNSVPWLKIYTPFYENYFLLMRAKRLTKENVEMFYPFMKVGMPVSELHKLEGFYFNPRKLSEIAAIAFNHGAPV